MRAPDPTTDAQRRGRLQRRTVEVASLDEFDAAAATAESMNGWHVRHVDLTSRTDALLRLEPAGALFLGCRLEPAVLVHLDAGGALVYPDVPGVPVDEYRNTLYTPDELYAGVASGYAGTPDARIYAWSQAGSSDPSFVAARALHDAAIGAALDVVLAADGRRVVGVMGGHAVARGSDDFVAAARLGWLLDRAGLHVATGGGPGAMEAANLGAYLAPRREATIAAAAAVLAATPSFRPSVAAWAAAALEVRARWPGGASSLGVPTWHYGHEPPNAFASGIAKFLQNSVREATLLNRCTGGVVFLRGAAGTVQEVFQDACENYYADPAYVAPMVLVGEAYWTRDLPAWPLLQALAEGRGMADSIVLVGDVDEAAAFVDTYWNRR